MLIIAGHLHMAPADRDAYVAAFTDLVRRARAAPGNLDVAISADPVDPGRVNTLERWLSWADVVAWRAVADAPDPQVGITSADVSMWDASGERDPFDEGS